jgi:hypothetical protein
VDRVSFYVERTAHHLKGDATDDLALFLDADLEVLSRSPAEYSMYAQQVRRVRCEFTAIRSPRVFLGFAGPDAACAPTHALARLTTPRNSMFAFPPQTPRSISSTPRNSTDTSPVPGQFRSPLFI